MRLFPLSALCTGLLAALFLLPGTSAAEAQAVAKPQAVAPAAPALAAPASAAPARAEDIPALAAFFRDGGTHGYYMGRAAGLDGWFLMMTQNRVQIAYIAPAGDILVIGALFNADGGNITERQLVELRSREPAVNALFTDTVQHAQEKLVRASGMDRVMKDLDPAKKGDQLYLELAQSFSAQLGRRDAPLLFMVIDPNCPFCKRAWKAIAPGLTKAGVQVRVIPVGILGEDSIRMAGKLLDTDKPGALWAKFAEANFDKAVLDGVPSEDAKAKVQVNRALFDRWHLTATPFFAYRAKNGQVKVLNQMPEDAKALLADIAPVPPAAPATAPAVPPLAPAPAATAAPQ